MPGVGKGRGPAKNELLDAARISSAPQRRALRRCQPPGSASPLLAVRRRDRAARRGGRRARTLERREVATLAGSTAGTRARTGGDSCALLPRALDSAASAGRSGVVGVT